MAKHIDDCQTPEELAEVIECYLKQGGMCREYHDQTGLREVKYDEVETKKLYGTALNKYNEIRESHPNLPPPQIATSDTLSGLAQIQELCKKAKLETYLCASSQNQAGAGPGNKDAKSFWEAVQEFFSNIKKHPIIIAGAMLGVSIIFLANLTGSIDELWQLGSKWLPGSSHAISGDPKPKQIAPVVPEASPVNPKQPLPKKKSTKVAKPLEIKSRGFNDIDSTPTLSEIQRSDSDIRKVVSAAAIALQGEIDKNRMDSVEALLSSLPGNLNAKEIAMLVGSETIIYRSSILKRLTKRMKLRTLDPEDIPLILDVQSDSRRSYITESYRADCIQVIASYIEPPITGRQAAAILGTEKSLSRVKCLEPLAPLLQRPLSESEVETILKGISTTFRKYAIKALFDQTKGKQSK